MPFQARTVIEEAKVSELIAQSKEKYPRIREAVDGWCWRLARDPDVGYQLPGPDPKIFVVRTGQIEADGVPEMTILYKYNDNEVNIRALRIISD